MVDQNVKASRNVQLLFIGKPRCLALERAQEVTACLMNIGSVRIVLLRADRVQILDHGISDLHSSNPLDSLPCRARAISRLWIMPITSAAPQEMLAELEAGCHRLARSQLAASARRVITGGN